jgi:N-acetylmuramoyl-L-alanine amidase
MRHIDKIILHCSATLPGQRVDVETITRWHKARGFKTIGYHFFIDRSGTIHPGRPLTMVGAHCKGHNARSIGVCYIGGLDSNDNPCDTRTPAQRRAMRQLIDNLRTRYPSAKVVGHNRLSAKACPCFDAESEYESSRS